MKDLPVVLLVLDQTNHASRRRGNDPVARSTQDYTFAFGAAKGNTSLAHFGTAFNGRRNDYVSSISGQPWFRFATLSWSPDIIFCCRDRSHYFSIQCPLWVMCGRRPLVKGFSGDLRLVGCKSCVRPVCAAVVTAGPDVICGIGSQSKARALQSA
jgi:hypothetical protein